MKVTIDARNQAEASALRIAMQDPTTRAFVVIIGTLLQLDTDRARARVLRFVADKLQEDGQLPVTPRPQIHLHRGRE